MNFECGVQQNQCYKSNKQHLKQWWRLCVSFNSVYQKNAFWTDFATCDGVCVWVCARIGTGLLQVWYRDKMKENEKGKQRKKVKKYEKRWEQHGSWRMRTN